MSDMDRLYLWRVNKPGHRVHILDSETGRTFCQVENCGGKPFDGRGAEIPDGRRVCQNCADLAGRNEADYREPDIRVLMGERLAEVEPMLFAGTAEPKRPKRAKQARPAALLKTPSIDRGVFSKPKRSNVKYAKPFDDPLPW